MMRLPIWQNGTVELWKGDVISDIGSFLNRLTSVLGGSFSQPFAVCWMSKNVVPILVAQASACGV
jgi:hypothetical protein